MQPIISSFIYYCSHHLKKTVCISVYQERTYDGKRDESVQEEKEKMDV